MSQRKIKHLSWVDG